MTYTNWFRSIAVGVCALCPPLVRGLVVTYDGVPRHFTLSDSAETWARYDTAFDQHLLWTAATFVVSCVVIALWARRKGYSPWLRVAAALPWVLFGWFENLCALGDAWLRGFDFD